MTAQEQDRRWAQALHNEELLASYRFAGPHKLSDRASQAERSWAEAVVEELARRGITVDEVLVPGCEGMAS